MTVEHPPTVNKVIVNTDELNQIVEATGVSYDQANQAYIASGNDLQRAITMLTNPPDHNASLKGVANQTGTGTQTFIGPQNAPGKPQTDVIDLTKETEDLEYAIALSLRDAQGISVEEQDISRVLEASLAENKSGLKRKRGDPWVRFVDPVNPYERQRLDGCPVGLKNVGNTCWFSAVIQVCTATKTC
ncbi:ubiquitin carboxyl-terminal hydrolase 25-like [Stylophora pistillata]|uniref:ubiquitin carboxyl-terminal hydrolase 25-like n=1 Tax=Stylophora pistillata TaxID=50429 RepID=UPI000C0474C5|nr:ubiquitin carboxyl-terminal hydrolase 25-like [Stylophora pistillata]